MAKAKQVDYVKFCEVFNKMAKEGKQAGEIAAVLGMNKNSVLTRASMYRGQGIPIEHLVRGNQSGVGGRKFDLAGAIAAAKRGSGVVEDTAPVDGEAQTETAETAENVEGVENLEQAAV